MPANIQCEKKGLNEQKSDVIIETIERMRCAFEYSSLSEQYPDVISSLSTVFMNAEKFESTNDRQKRYNFITARNTRTLKRLREKGYCREKTINQLKQAAFSQTYLAATYVCIVFEKAVEESFGHGVDLESPVGEDVWIRAIEQTQIIQKPAMINEQQTNLTFSAIDNIEYVYFLACVFCGLDWFSRETKEICMRLDETEKNAEDKPTKPVEAKSTYLVSEYYNAWKAEEDRLNKRIHAYEKESARLHHENGRLKAENERLTSNIEILSSNGSDENRIGKEEENEPPLDDNQVKSSEFCGELPERAVFLGGHPNMVKKLRERHPDWIYISPEDDKAAFINEFNTEKIETIIYWSKHVSHILDRKIRKAYPNIPVIYVTSTNVGMLEEEIRRRYTALISRICIPSD